jgi:hypothetical protein
MTSTTYIIGPRAVRVAYLPITMFVVEIESQLFDVVKIKPQVVRSAIRASLITAPAITLNEIFMIL